MMNQTYQRANTRCPNMGLDNKPCNNPTYWCPLHEVWLSEEDVKKKGCRFKQSPDMLSIRPCTLLQKKDYQSYLQKLYQK